MVSMQKANRCVLWFKGREISAKAHRYEGKVIVFIEIDSNFIEISEQEIIDRAEQYKRESEERSF